VRRRKIQRRRAARCSRLSATPALTFDHFYSDDELTALVRAWAAERPDLAAVESIGRSYEGRDVWLVTLTNRATGPPLEKPALLVEANMHSVEWTASTAALHLIAHVLERYGADERVTRLLDTRCLYVVPRLNPDGADRALREGRFIRSSVRPYPHERPRPGLRADDVDGDGRLLFMRQRDANGPWRRHHDEPRLLVPREPDEAGGEYYRLYPEGEIEGWDGETVTVAPPLEGLDIGVNLPGEWHAHWRKAMAGPYPGSEPEIAALVRAVTERPNITGHIGCHTFGGVVFRPGGDDLPADDVRAYRVLGERAEALTGYPARSEIELWGDEAPSFRGWFYEHVGVYSWTTEFWNPWRAAGIASEHHGSRWLAGEHPVEDELRLIRWSDEALGGRGFVDWYPFAHPQLGAVELGGWDVINYWYNPPFELLESEVAPHSEWAVFHALASPLLEVRSFTAAAAAPGVHRVRLVVQNTGWLPTAVTKQALEGHHVGPVVVELELPEAARLLGGRATTEAGQLEGRIAARSSAVWWSYRPETDDRALVEWLVGAPEGAVLRAAARHARAGTARAELRLG
jgi:murein tripeptide amidase MpaA